MKTYSQKAGEVTREWILFDASEAPLGRLATVVAQQLIGKHRPTYTPHIDSGNYVVVINAAQTVVTGAKETDKQYYRHSGYPGGIKARTVGEQRDKDPTQLIIKAVKGMLPKNKLQSPRLSRLKVFADDQHTHTAQQPKKVTLS